MTEGGWLVMVVSVGSVLGLFLWCLWKVVSTPRDSERLHGAAGLDTPDSKEDES